MKTAVYKYVFFFNEYKDKNIELIDNILQNTDSKIKESVLLNMCQNCFYDAERTVGALCSIGLEFMIHQYDNTLI